MNFKKSLFVYTSIFTLASAFYSSNSKADANLNVPAIVKKEESILKNTKRSEQYKYDSDYPVFLTGSEVPQIIALYSKESDDSGYDYIIDTMSYNSKTNKWSNIYTRTMKNVPSIIVFRGKGKLIDNKKEQIVLSAYKDNVYDTAYPILYGSLDNKTVKPLLDYSKSKGINFGDVVIKNKTLYFTSDHFVKEKYVFKNNKFIRTDGKGSDDLYLASGVKHLLYLQKKTINGTTEYLGPKTINMKVGEKFKFIRNVNDSFDYAYRFAPDTGDELFDLIGSHQYITAIKPGTSKWILQPNRFESKSVTITINVTK